MYSRKTKAIISIKISIAALKVCNYFIKKKVEF